MALFTPTNQKRLTNVSVVRLRKGGHRYELACYPNKVRAWRDRLETNLDEVLQIYTVFTNVSKGQFANKKEMFQVFGTEDETQIIKTILEHGELNLTEKERSLEQTNMFRDVAKLVSDRCVNPETNRAYTVTMIEKMMKDCHISLKANKTAKQHALEVVKQLRSVDGFKIAPAMMEVVISVEATAVDSVKDQLLQLCTSVLREGFTSTGNYDLAVVIEPDKYGAIGSLLRNEVKGKYSIEIVGDAKHGNHHVSTPVTEASTSQPHRGSKKGKSIGQSSSPQSIIAEQSEEQNAVSKASDPSTSSKIPASSAKKTNRHRKQKKRKGRDDDWPDDSGDGL